MWAWLRRRKIIGLSEAHERALDQLRTSQDRYQKDAKDRIAVDRLAMEFRRAMRGER